MNRYTVLALCLLTNSVYAKQLTLTSVKTNGVSLSAPFLQQMIDLFQVQVFVETGTCMGESTACAAKLFKTVHTTELNNELYHKACTRFAPQNHVHVHEGDSGSVLPKILQNTHGRILFWLDAHYYSDFNRGHPATPIMEELAVIKASGITDAIILVDDICSFKPFKKVPHISIDGFPSVQELREAILAINSSYIFVVFGDIALAYPASEGIMPSPVLQACTVSRLYDGNNLPLTMVVEAEKIIAHAQGAEANELLNLAAWRGSFTGAYYTFWAGLVRWQHKEFIKAFELFGISVQQGFDQWRISWYASRTLQEMTDAVTNTLHNRQNEMAQCQQTWYPINTKDTL